MRDTTRWGSAQLAKLRREYPIKNTAQLADELGMSLQRVRWRASLMGLKKDVYGLHEKRRQFLDGIMAEYVYSTAREIAKRHGVSVPCVRLWIREARYGQVAARSSVREVA